MSYPDTISSLESQVAHLQDARMQEARERDRLRSERNALAKALDEILACGSDHELHEALIRARRVRDAVGPAVCAKCGCETKGEVALVHDAEWCHPCADKADFPAPVGKGARGE